MREYFNKINQNKKVNNFLEKYNVSKDFFSTRRKFIIRGAILGLLIAFIPMPMQMFSVILFMPFIRFNLPIAIALCWITNPISMPFIYMLEYNIGSYLLDYEIKNVEFSLNWIFDNFSKIFIPLYFGAAVMSIVSSSIAYFGINYFWNRSLRKKKVKSS